MPYVEAEREVTGQDDLALETEGWQRRFEADATRTGELVDLYSDLGYEVTTRKIAPQEIGPQCAGCAIVACERYVALFTRRPDAERSHNSPVQQPHRA
ncbi:MAG TPA: hypothetical protein VIM47_08830 [Dermatophilaceae bacterium]|jgi:hypothetical protein